MLNVAMLMMNTTGGSNRLNVYNPLRKLAEIDPDYHVELEIVKGIPDTADIAVSYEDMYRIASTYDVIVVSKVLGDNVIHLTQLARSMGKIVIYVVSDLYSSHDVFFAVNASVVGSRYMKCLLESTLQLGNIYWIDDTIESPPELRKEVYTAGKNLSAVWFGCCNDNYRIAKGLAKDVLNNIGWTFTFIGGEGRDEEDIPYSVETVYQEIIKHDVVYIPTVLTHVGQCKSAGRVVFSQQLAMPVIVGPIYSYVEQIDPFVTGLVCYTEKDWHQSFNSLKYEQFRKYLGENARKSVAGKFTAEVHAIKWRDIIQEVLCLREKR
jgi:glycosyltransferase involved in cell wall biosynthesis